MRQSGRYVRSILIVVGALLLAAPGAHAAVTVSLPFEGRFEPGRFMPVRVNIANEPHDVLLHADGAVTTRLESGPDGEKIIPILTVSESLKELQSDGSAPVRLRALVENER